jgi:hypothetical protein
MFFAITAYHFFLTLDANILNIHRHALAITFMGKVNLKTASESLIYVE